MAAASVTKWMLGRSSAAASRARSTSRPVMSPAWTIRRALWPPSRVRSSWPSGRVSKCAPSAASSRTRAGPSRTVTSTASVWFSATPASRVSARWSSKLSRSESTAATPPCA